MCSSAKNLSVKLSLNFGAFLIIILFGVFAFANNVSAEQDFVIQDSDNDGLSDYDEQNLYYTNPLNPDTDGDGYFDGQEIKFGYSPHMGDGVRLSKNDFDKDGMNDYLEIAFHTNLINPDTDGDGYFDGLELRYSYDPRIFVPKKIKKRIIVDLSEQMLRYYWDDIKMGEFLISSGRATVPTPLGKFSINTKLPVHTYSGANYYYPNTKWNMRFHGTPPYSYYIHGAFWHDNFGTPMSGGCINVSYDKMEGLYHWAEIGTEVEIIE